MTRYLRNTHNYLTVTMEKPVSLMPDMMSLHTCQYGLVRKNKSIIKPGMKGGENGFPLAYCNLNEEILSDFPVLSSEYISIAIHFIVIRSLYVISISLYITFKSVYMIVL